MNLTISTLNLVFILVTEPFMKTFYLDEFHVDTYFWRDLYVWLYYTSQNKYRASWLVIYILGGMSELFASTYNFPLCLPLFPLLILHSFFSLSRKCCWKELQILWRLCMAHHTITRLDAHILCSTEFDPLCQVKCSPQSAIL